LVEGAEAEVYTVVIILAIVLVYTDGHNTMATTKLSFGSPNQPANLCSWLTLSVADKELFSYLK
jgi:hypothetical protein